MALVADQIAGAAADLRQVVEAIHDRPNGWHLWVIAGGRYTALRPGTTCDRCKAKARAFFGGSALRGERFVITGPDGTPHLWADPVLGHPLRLVWRQFS